MLVNETGCPWGDEGIVTLQDVRNKMRVFACVKIINLVLLSARQMNNLIFFSFAKSSSSAPVYSFCTDPSTETSLKTEVVKVITQLKNINLNADERQKISTNNGSWYCKKDDKQMFYMILAVPSYPEPYAYKAIGELIDQLKKFGPTYNTQEDITLKTQSKPIMKEIMKKYEVPQEDKVGIAKGKAEELRDSVRSSVRKILTNQVQLESLQEKSLSLRDNANKFSVSATELERLMYWRNCKLKIIIGLIVVSILAYILVPIIQKATAK